MVETILHLNATKPEACITVLALVRNEQKAQQRFAAYNGNRYLKFLVQDVCDPLPPTDTINFIIHAASQASPLYYGTDPVGTLSANVLGTLNLLNLARTQQIESFLYFSSSEVYGQVEEELIPIDENTFGYLSPTVVRSCYAESKRMGENMCVSYASQFGVPAKIVRVFHTYGPGMPLNDGRVFVDFVSNVLQGRDIEMHSDGSARRAYCYLTDATIAYFMILLTGVSGQSYNVGNPAEEYSVLELARLISSLSPHSGLRVRELPLNPNSPYVPSAVNRVSPRIDKAKALGWMPQVSASTGFARAIASYLPPLEKDLPSESI
jgi:UDP-glucuronate decarboxylase